MLGISVDFSNFGSLKSTETHSAALPMPVRL